MIIIFAYKQVTTNKAFQMMIFYVIKLKGYFIHNFHILR